ncbi:hypothetical protein HG535_0E02980 [Zygotorulaspora mrakii]|uniref:Transcriptional regulatory protein DEP1 n=1 Tax=Zygotorulaspora mrakii TaxID=42260 RepID=A0A7H9B4C0_ZYGMR|nr:uncharacterized protein HG535_0E02980 [Zygotorulaspora mrakii]QLG73214.1 hypothetical protein HG535_0E02980 [Zygotorulaspora mrakii]
MDQKEPKETKSKETNLTCEIIEGVQKNGDISVKASEREEDEESLLSSIEHQESDLNKLDISDYCVSSDAETEKMSDDKVQQGLDANHPHIADLLSEIDAAGEVDKKRANDEKNDEEERKRVKLENPVAGVQQNGNIDDEDENEAGDEEEDDQEAAGVLKKEVPTQSIDLAEKHPEQPLERVGEVVDEKVENGVSKKSEDYVERAAKESVEPDTEEEEVEEEEAEEEEAEEEETEEEEAEEEPEPEEEPEEEPDAEEEQLIRELPEVEDDSANHAVIAKEPKKESDKPLSTMPSPIEIEQQRLDALKEITEIEYKFVELRQKLYDNKLLRLQMELQMCREGSHPELQSYYQKIASIRDYKLRRAYQRQKYELKCIDKETRATRTFIHQDFIRQVNDTRSQLLNNTTQKWYDINKERRDMDICVPEVNYHVPIKIAGKTLSCITGYAGPAQQRYPGEPLPEDLECENIQIRYRSNAAVDKLEVIVDRMRLNNELSDLEGLKRFYNAFPGAPELSGLRDSEVFDDIQKLPLQR